MYMYQKNHFTQICGCDHMTMNRNENVLNISLDENEEHVKDVQFKDLQLTSQQIRFGQCA